MGKQRREAASDQPAMIVVFGDQLDHRSAALRRAVKGRDTVVMMEVREESTHVPSHAQRSVLFLSAMRHFAQEVRAAGHTVRYVELNDKKNTQSFTGEVERAAREIRPGKVVCVEPGEWRVRRMVEGWSSLLGVPVEILPDEHFLCSTSEFAAFTNGRKSLIMEHFYRWQRKRLNVLMEPDDPTKPLGGDWNLDSENRKSFGKAGPNPKPPRPPEFPPDEITSRVIEVVRAVMPDLPGRIEPFGWPVTRADALVCLKDFVKRRLPAFGPYEDAMWTGEPFLYHSLLSPALNLKMLSPRECIDAALAALAAGRAPLQSVEGFVRQIIGWREFIRGVYWQQGESYGQRNGLEESGALPWLYWSGKTDMACLRECLGQVLDRGFGHHIQRLMVTGNFALTAGVHPRAVSNWYLGMYVDGVDWVTLPNTLGMVMHADGGVVGTKPYAASGKYIERMSNYCTTCRYDPGKRHGEEACPFTVFYWDFLNRHREQFAGNQRMTMMLKNLDRLSEPELTQITVSAHKLRRLFGVTT